MKSFLREKMVNKIITFCVMLFIILSPSFVKSATLFTSPQEKSVRVGDTFTVYVNTNSQGSYINAASLDVKYDVKMLSVQGVGHSGSIFSMWSEEPSYSNINGVIHFSGGLASPGFNGSSGNIIKIIFKAKAIGQTKLTLRGGSTLANDGIGTDILNSVSGTNINITEATAKVTEPVVSKVIEKESVTEKVVASSSVPILENLPDQLTEGDTLSFNGIGNINGQVQVYIQKGKKDIEITQINTKEDGKFNVTYRSPVLSGYYKIWAKNLSDNGVLSSSSFVSYVEVVNRNMINIMGLNIYYRDLLIIVVVISILFLIMFIIFLNLYIKVKKSKKGRKKISKNEILDTE